MARGKRLSPERILMMLGQSEVQLAQGESLALACKEAGISEQSSRTSA
jgi:putative transposase